jgi:rod shape-determining protein MreC
LNFFNIDLKKLVMIVIVLVLPLVSINMQQRPQESNWLSRPFSILASLAEETFFVFSSGVRGTTAMYLDLVNIKKTNRDLATTNNELLARMTEMTELKTENDRLKGLLDFRQSTKMDLATAQIISRDLLSDQKTVTINKGTKDGLKAGMAVITVDGVLGYIYRPEVMNSKVMLITDRYAVVDGVVQRTRAHGIVEGKSPTVCQLKYVEKTEDVKKGDLVVTGGLDNIFPKGFPVAVVESVERKNFSVSLKVDLKPVVDPFKVEEVFVVVNAANSDLSDRLPPQASADPAAAAIVPTTGVAAPAPATSGNSLTTAPTTAKAPSAAPATHPSAATPAATPSATSAAKPAGTTL